MTWTPIQLDYRTMIARILVHQTDVRVTLEGLAHVFPPSQRVLVRDPVSLCDRFVTRTTMELLERCMGEAGVRLEVSTPATPYSLGWVRFTLINDPR